MGKKILKNCPLTLEAKGSAGEKEVEKKVQFVEGADELQEEDLNFEA